MEEPIATPATDFNWDRLIDSIRDGILVPVVGEALGEVDVEGVTKPFSEELACQVAIKLKIDPWAGISLSALASRYPQHIVDIKRKLFSVHEELLPAVRYGVGIQQLCSINNISLFLTSAVDCLLERVLTEVRGIPPKVYKIGPGTQPDSNPTAALASGSEAAIPSVVHLFSHIDRGSNFALTEEDTLEWLWHDPRPDPLLDALQDRDLLFIGNRFPDWLMRMFMRSLRRGPLSKDTDTYKTLTKDQIPEPALHVFLERLGTQLCVYDGSVDGFMRELHARWASQVAASPASSSSASYSFAARQKHDVFISYAHEDRAAAVEVRRSLATINVDGWFDVTELQSGDAYDAMIRSAIEGCTLFIALVSKTTEAIGTRYFHREWNWAVNHAELKLGCPYLLPFVIDDDLEPGQLQRIPDEFRRLTMRKAPGGVLSAEQLERLKQDIRLARASEIGR